MCRAPRFRRAACLPIAALAMALPAASQAQTTYTILDIGAVAGTFSRGYAINNSGQVAGLSNVASSFGQHTFRYANGTLTDLPTLGGNYGTGFAINSSGQIAGRAYLAGDEIEHAALWTGTTIKDLGTFGGTYAEGYGINESGVVVGISTTPDNLYNHAFRYADSTMAALPGLGGGSTEAYAINQSGQIAGDAETTTPNVIHAVVWTGNTVTDLGTLEGGNSFAQAINNRGQIAGTSYKTTFATRHAVLWNGTTVTDLGTLGGTHSQAKSINASGDVVGAADAADGVDHAFLYSGGQMVDCNDLLPAHTGWLLTDASGINDDGWITGQGTIRGEQHAYLLKPPASTGTSRLALEGVADLSATSPAAPLGPFHFSFRTPGTTIERYRKDVMLTTTPGSAFGTYTLYRLPNGTYDIAIKSDKSLRVLIPDFSVNGMASLPDVTLPAGDADNNNNVDIADFGVLVNAFGGDAGLPGSGYDSSCDFDYDGHNDIADFGLLVNEYGNAGAL